MSFALIFSGQGMQHPAMLSWLAEDELLSVMARVLGADWRQRLQDPAWAGRNAHAQVLLTGLGLAAWTQLAPRLPEPAVVAGYSVGEVAAFAAAGVCTPGEAIELVQCRAALMDRDAERCAAGLLAVSGLADEAMAQLCNDFGLLIAIRNDPVSVVLACADHTLVFRMTPHGPLKTDTEAIWLVNADAMEGRDYDVDRIVAVWLPTLGEDKTITENNQAGILSSRYVPGPYQSQEQRISDFGQWYYRQLATL